MKRNVMFTAAATAAIASLMAAPSAALADADNGAEPTFQPAAAALANPLTPGTYAGDVASGPVVLEFSNANFTDTEEEDWDIATVMLTIAAELTVTDGGDGSAATWTSALDGVDVLVLPEGGNWEPGGTSAISDAALEVIREWTEAGGAIVGTGSYDHYDIVSELTGIDYQTQFWNNDSEGPWARQIADERIPETVPNGNYTGGLVGYSTWSAEQKAIVTPIYYSTDTDNLAMAKFAIGEGSYTYIAYDWYPDSDELTNGVRDTWNEVLKFGASSAVPQQPTKSLDIALNVAIGEQLKGGTIAVGASGLQADAPWNLVLRSEPVQLGAGIVPDSGSVNTTVTLPQSLPVGWHRLIFTSIFEDGTDASWVRWIKIAGDGTLLAISETEPAPELAETGADGIVPALGGFAAALLAAGAMLVVVRRQRVNA